MFKDKIFPKGLNLTEGVVESGSIINHQPIAYISFIINESCNSMYKI